MEHEQRNDALSPDEAVLAAARRERIDEGLETAGRQGRRIDDLTAKRIAREFDPGNGPLHDFAETGAIPEGVEADLDTARRVLQDLESEEQVPWIAALRAYFDGRAIKSEMPYWDEPGME